LPSLLDLDADDDRSLLTRIVAHLHRDDIGSTTSCGTCDPAATRSRSTLT
jgi:hypothetical protein